jgi:N-acetylglucosaminyldiphosphoundecaprenol N-acetyl-beta-D-mannosaminyltransferase
MACLESQSVGPATEHTRAVLGVEVAVTDNERELARIAAMVESGSRGYICHAAVGTLMNARRDPQARAALAGATMTVPDGMPVVWALRALGERIEDRVYGPDLMLMACERLGDCAHFLYGGRDAEATAALERRLRERFPNLRLAGSLTPPFRELTAAEEDDVASRIDASGAEVVWVGTGSPRQEKWMASMRPRLHAPVLVGVGAAFDFHAGLVPQAPGWMQRHGLEWLFRLRAEPRRLAPRYLRDNPAFIAAFARQWLSERRGSSPDDSDGDAGGGEEREAEEAEQR